MDKIFNRAEDKNVAARIVYKNNGTLYYDADFTEEVPEDEMKNLFVKGVLLADGDNFYAATKFEDGAIVFAEAEEAEGEQ